MAGVRAPLGELTCRRRSSRLEDDNIAHQSQFCMPPHCPSSSCSVRYSFGEKHWRQQRVASKLAETVRARPLLNHWLILYPGRRGGGGVRGKKKFVYQKSTSKFEPL